MEVGQWSAVQCADGSQTLGAGMHSTSCKYLQENLEKLEGARRRQGCLQPCTIGAVCTLTNQLQKR